MKDDGKLEEIGFYTLDDKRAMTADATTPLHRCELILTDACNFKCPYCRGLKEELKGSLSYEEAKRIVDIWGDNKLKNVRFSGGEPTIWPHLVKLIKHTKSRGVERIALSTNGSADFEFYQELIDAGVNDFSISLDACCASYGDKMAGDISGAWEKLVENIRKISKLTYVTVGVVVTEETVPELAKTIEFADSLGVSDIRIISAAQFNQLLVAAKTVDQDIVDKYPILKYRMANINNEINVRGLEEKDNHSCPLALDDMAVSGGKHFPCIIYMREYGNAIGEIGDDVRKQREEWVKNHDTHKDPICKGNCLDVCIKYNNRHMEFSKKKSI